MNPFLFALLFAAFIAFAVWLIRKNSQIVAERNQRLESEARQHGWHFSRNPGYRQVDVSVDDVRIRRTSPDDVEFTIEGRIQDVPWRMWYDTGRRFDTSTSSSGSDASAVWACDGVRSRELSVLILPRWQYRIESSHAFGAVAAVAKAAFTLGDADERDSRQRFFTRALELTGTDPGLHNAYAVLVGRDVPHDWLDQEIQSLLLHMPKPLTLTNTSLVASLGAAGLRIDFQRPNVESWPFWEQFGRLGQALAQRLVRSKVAELGASS